MFSAAASQRQKKSCKSLLINYKQELSISAEVTDAALCSVQVLFTAEMWCLTLTSQTKASLSAEHAAQDFC